MEKPKLLTSNKSIFISNKNIFNNEDHIKHNIVNNNNSDYNSGNDSSIAGHNPNILSSLKPFYYECQLLLHKKQYRKVYDEIDNKENLITKTPFYIDFVIIKIQAILKIIQNRLNRYLSTKFQSTNQWFKKLESKIEEFHALIVQSDEAIKKKSTSVISIKNINKDNSKIDSSLNIEHKQESKAENINHDNNKEELGENKLEILEVKSYSDFIELEIFFISQSLYLQAQFNQIEGNWADCVSFLSIGEKIINSFSSHCSNNKTLNCFQNILLMISSILLADNDYYQAIKIQNNALNVCFRELFLLTDIREGLEADLTNLKLNPLGKITLKEAFHCFEKLIVNIVSVLFHQGMALENLGQLKDSLFYYSQAKFFSEKYLGTKYSEFLEFIINVEIRLKKYIDIIDKLQDAAKSKSNDTNDRKNTSLSGNRLKNENKSLDLVKAKIEDFISKMKPNQIKELELDSRSKNSSFDYEKILFHNKLVNKILSDEFKDIVLNKLKNVNLTIFDSRTYDLIQRKIIDLRNEEFMKKVNNKGEIEGKVSESSPRKERNSSFSNGDSSIINNLGSLKRNSTYNKSNVSNRKGSDEDKNLINKNKSASKGEKNKINNDSIDLANKDEYRKIENNNPTNSIFNRSKSAFGKGINKIRFNKDPKEVNLANLSIRENKIIRKDSGLKILDDYIDSKNKNKNCSAMNKSLNNRNDIIPDIHRNVDLTTCNKINNANTKKSVSKQKRPNSVVISRTADGEKPVIKYEHSKYILAKGYRKKYSLFENISDKDNSFHKQLLSIKKEQKIPITILSQEKIQEEAKDYYSTVIKTRKIIHDQHLIRISNYEVNKLRSQRSAILNQNYSIYEKFLKNETQNDSYYNKMIQKFKNKINIEYGTNKDSSKVVNKKIQDVINIELEQLDNYIKKEEKKYNGEIKVKKKWETLGKRSQSVIGSFISRTNSNLDL